MTRFTKGQIFTSKRDPSLTATATQLKDDGRKAWLEVRTADGDLQSCGWFTYAEIIGAWTPKDGA
jgi:hypothetical protein